MSLMLGKNISSTCKIRYVRYITLSYQGSSWGAHGIVHRACTRQRRDLRLTGHGPRMPIQLPLAGDGHVSTLDYTLNVPETRHKSMLRALQRYVDRTTSIKSLGSSATEPTSGPKLVTLKQETSSGRSFRSRDTTHSHMSGHEDAHGG